MRAAAAAVLIALVGSSGCSGATAEPSAADDERVDSRADALTVPIHHVVLVSGGFGSCEPNGVRGVLPTEIAPLLASIEAHSGSEPTVVRTCFGGIGDPDRLDFMITEGTTVLRAGSATVSTLESLLRTELAESTPSRLDAYGHSHGGWLVGRVVQDLGPGTAQSFTLNVVLSDAISRTLCTPSVVIFGAGRSDACGHFPLDLDVWRIRANVHGYLGSAFQNEDWLHSTPLPGVENRAFSPGFPPRPRAFNHRALYTLPLNGGAYESRFQYR